MINFKILCIFSIFVQLCQINCFSVDEINTNTYTMEQEAKLDTIILGAGCFWCVEADFAEAGDQDVHRKIKEDLKDHNISEEQIRNKMDELNEKAKSDFS